jgi:hypothetical protein
MVVKPNSAGFTTIHAIFADPNRDSNFGGAVQTIGRTHCYIQRNIGKTLSLRYLDKNLYNKWSSVLFLSIESALP